MLRRIFTIRWIDECRTRRIGELLGILWLLAFADLVFTIWAHLFTPFAELNPLASPLLQHHQLLSLASGKVLLTMIGSIIFWFLRKNRRAELALWIVVLVYVGLMVRWSDYTSEVLIMGIVQV